MLPCTSMFHTTQWVKPPCTGASGSCKMSANDFAPAGIPLTLNGGLTSWPSQEYLDGIIALFAKAALVTVNSALPVNDAITVIIINTIAMEGKRITFMFKDE